MKTNLVDDVIALDYPNSVSARNQGLFPISLPFRKLFLTLLLFRFFLLWNNFSNINDNEQVSLYNPEKINLEKQIGEALQ